MKFTSRFASLLLWALLILPVTAAVYRMEPENFPDKKSWKQDVGSNAAGKYAILSTSKIDNEISGDFLIPEEGIYTLWVRSFGYGGQERRSRIFINGENLGVFGDNPLPIDGPKAGFSWDKGGKTISLKPGRITLTVTPLSTYARMDSVLLSSDPDWKPSDQAAQINAIPELKAQEPLPQGTVVLPQGAVVTQRIEPEFFQDTKSWSQSLDANCSGKCQIVSTTTDSNSLSEYFQLPGAGTYTVWVRSFSFGQNGRHFRLSLNGEDFGLFGDSAIPEGLQAPCLVWEKAPAALTATSQQLAVTIQPVSPYCRIDSIILTTDPSFVPSDQASQLNAIPELKSKGIAKLAPAAKKTSDFPPPAFKGKGEPVLILSGGRPWTGSEFGDFMQEAGAKVKTLNSIYLAGLGGAPIRPMLGDAYEPEPADGITPEFQQLSQYKVVVINAMPPECQEKLFTPDRITALKKYVSEGGALLLTQNAPAALSDLLPVNFTEKCTPKNGETITRPADKAFDYLPESWLTMDPFKKVRAKENARSLSQIRDAAGETIADYIVEMPYGKGKVVFLNGQFARQQGVVQIYNWAYGRALMATLIQQAGNIPMNPQALISQPGFCPAPRNLEKAAVSLSLPEMELADASEAPRQQENRILFANGMQMEIDAKGAVALTYPGCTSPAIAGFRPPELLLAATQQKLASETSEAVDVQQKMVSQTVWTYRSCRMENNQAILSYASNNGAEMEWIFKAGTLKLDGRIYTGFAQKARILKAPTQISALAASCQLKLDATFARRMDCYQSPRGYVDLDLSGATAADSRPNNFFCDSQPFGYINTKDGIFVEFLEEILPTTIRFTRQPGDPGITATETQLIGRRNAPVEGAFFWQMISKGPECRHNDYMAIWQFCRHYLRKVAGLKEYPNEPVAAYTNVCSDAERRLTIAAAGKMGIPLMRLPLCPSSIDSIDCQKNMNIYKEIREAGMKAEPWTACDYTEGTGDWIFQKKQDWLMRDEKGGIYAYFVNHRVIDLANPEFLDWYFTKLKHIFDAGVGYVYLDMGGQASTNVNFAGTESNPGLLNQVKIFRYYHANDVPCGVEGMNPLVIDNYWYRPKLYGPMGGKEFAFIGSKVSNDEGEDFYLNYFRTAMYCAFSRLHLDGFAQDFERIPNANANYRRIARLLPAMNKALSYGMPFIREEEFGTTWISKKGGAIFVWDPVAELNVSLPAEYHFTTLQLPDGTTRPFSADCLKEIPSQSILLFEKNSTPQEGKY